MDVVVRAHNTSVGGRFRNNAQVRLERLAKLDGKCDRVEVDIRQERSPRQPAQRVRIELTCRTRGAVLRAVAGAADVFAALELAADKLDHQMRRAADRKRVHHGTRTPQSVANATSALLRTDRAIMSN
ncbi:MAG TPA: ribosome-associated translation inhibitor RaiA [Mycobacteriales bacterium]|nr:ribosome-associated translation inhibitor RaiA [Mycobacteriales bacterium]